MGEVIVWHKVFVSECHQLIGQRDEYESFRLGGKNVYYPFHGKVCSAYLHAIRPENAPIFAWTLFGLGGASLLLACVSGALLLKSAGCKAVPGGRYLAAIARCGATSVDELRASERVSDRFAGSAKELVTGQPEEAATGLYGIIGYEEAYLRERMAAGTAAIVAEAEALGDPEVLENLRYILDAPAGSVTRNSTTAGGATEPRTAPASAAVGACGSPTLSRCRWLAGRGLRKRTSSLCVCIRPPRFALSTARCAT